MANEASNFATLQKARQDLISEIDAIMEYDDHIHTTPDMLARQTWEDIRNEEMVHFGQLFGLISYLDPSWTQFVNSGMEEFQKSQNGQS